MPASPKVFISATSGDLRTIRGLVKDALLTKDCHPVEQTNFPPDSRTVTAMLRGRISGCQALIHIAGLRYGAEPDPATLPPGAPRRSYTQMEYDIGRELQAKRGPKRFRVYTFICPETFPYDTPADPATPPESEDKQLLQQAHRATLLADTHLYELVHNPEQLQSRLHALQEDLHHLRTQQTRATRLTLAAAALILLGLVGIGYWQWQGTKTASAVKSDTAEIKQTLHADPEQLRLRLRQQINDKADSEIAAVRNAGNDWREIEKIEEHRKAALGKVDDIIATIQAGLVGKPEPVLIEATRILQEKGANETVAYLRSQKQKLLEEAARLTTQEKEIQLRRQEKLRPLLLQAELHESNLAFDSALDLLELVVQQSPEWWQARNRLGCILHTLARHGEAEKHFRLAESLVANDEELTTALNNLAALLQATNRLTEAEPLMRRALAIDEASYGKDHPNVAVRLNNLALLLQDTNRLTEAELLMRRALAIDEVSYGKDHPDVAIDLNNLAQLLKVTNHLTEAEPLMARVVVIFEKALGENHPNVATALNNLAQLLKATNRLTEAEPLMRRALAIDEASYGKDHPNVAVRLNNLAQLRKATNRLTEAEPLMRRALAIDEVSYGKDHPDVAIDLNNLAQLLQETNRLTEAEPLMRRALAIDEASYGNDHPDVATALNNLAQLLQETNRLTEAEPLMRRALAIDEASYGKDHPNVARDLNNLAGLLQATNHLTEAEPLMRRALAIDEASFGNDHPNVAIRLNNLAQLLQATNRLTEAEPLSRRHLGIFLKFQVSTGHRHPHTFAAIKNYLSLCRNLKLPESEIHFRLDTLRQEAGLDQSTFDALWQELTALILAGPFNVTVTEALPGGQGQSLGLQPGDIILTYASQAITSTDQLIKLTSETQDPSIPLEIRRNQETLRLTAKPGKLSIRIENRPRPSAAPSQLTTSPPTGPGKG